jgi:hypothetical protein
MDALAYLESHQEEILARCVRQHSSVSTDPAYKEGVTRVSRWVADQLSAAGMQNVRTHPPATPSSPPIGWARRANRRSGLRPLQVQPPDPLDKWKSFAARLTVRANRLARRLR